MPEPTLVSSIEGPADAPVLVLGNPIGTTRDVWAYQVPVLSRHFRVLRYEPRGHGAPGVGSDLAEELNRIRAILITPIRGQSGQHRHTQTSPGGPVDPQQRFRDP